VVEAANGADAVRLAAKISPALAVLEIQSPDVNGFVVCKRLKYVGRLEHDLPESSSR
jgi:DNA-binding response OmpR family regulator